MGVKRGGREAGGGAQGTRGAKGRGSIDARCEARLQWLRQHTEKRGTKEASRGRGRDAQTHTSRAVVTWLVGLSAGLEARGWGRMVGNGRQAKPSCACHQPRTRQRALVQTPAPALDSQRCRSIREKQEKQAKQQAEERKRAAEGGSEEGDDEGDEDEGDEGADDEDAEDGAEAYERAPRRVKVRGLGPGAGAGGRGAGGRGRGGGRGCGWHGGVVPQ